MKTSLAVVAILGIPIVAVIVLSAALQGRNDALSFRLFTIGMIVDVFLFLGWGVYGIWWVTTHLCYY